MRTRHALLVGAVLLAGLAFAGASTVAATDGQVDDSINESTNGTESPQLGVCVIGVDSPCNGEQWDGDGDGELVPVEGDETRNGDGLQPVKNETRDGESPEPVKNGTGDEAEAGVCMIGVDSPCNGEQWDGDLMPVPDENRTGTQIDPGKGGESDEAGICLVGVDSPCNGDDGSGTSQSGIALDDLLGLLGTLF